MMGENDLKNRVGQGFIFHIIIPAHYSELVKELVRLKIIHTSACLNLIYGTIKQKSKT